MVSIQGEIGDVFILPVAGVGNPPSPNFPQRLLSLASLKIDVKAKNVNLMGQNQYPDDVMTSDKEASIEIEVGRVGIDLINMAAGEMIATGRTDMVIDEGGPGGTAVPVTPFQITVTGSANFVDDLAVMNAATGQQLQKVTSGPTAGQYSFAAGIYTFSTGDNVSGVKVKIRYTKAVTATGRTLSLGNHPQGFGPVVRVLANCPYTSPIATSPFGAINARSVKFNEIGMPFKRDGYLMVPMKGTMYPDGSGTVVDLWSPSAAS